LCTTTHIEWGRDEFIKELEDDLVKRRMEGTTLLRENECKGGG